MCVGTVVRGSESPHFTPSVADQREAGGLLTTLSGVCPRVVAVPNVASFVYHLTDMVEAGKENDHNIHRLGKLVWHSGTPRINTQG